MDQVDQRSVLLEKFRDFDPSNRGIISMNDFGNIIRREANIDEAQFKEFSCEVGYPPTLPWVDYGVVVNKIFNDIDIESQEQEIKSS